MLRKYAVLMRASWGLVLEYRASTFIWMLTNILPLVMLAVWLSLAEEGPIGAYGPGEFVSYYLGILVVRQFTTVWVIWDLDRQIRLGELSPKLLRPFNPLHEHIAFNLADKIFRVPILLPPVLAVALLVPGVHYSVTPLNVLAFILALAGAWAIRFMSQYAFGLLSFWISQALALNDIWFAGFMLLGGLIAPLDLFPPAISRVVQVLPFRFMLSFPVEIALGRLTPVEVVEGLGVQTIWLVIYVGVYWLLWRRGVRQYSAVGA